MKYYCYLLLAFLIFGLGVKAQTLKLKSNRIHKNKELETNLANSNITLEIREDIIFKTIKQGNVPHFLINLVKISHTEKIDGKDYNVLSSDKGKHFFDASTGLLYKSTADEGNATVKSYMTVDGMKFPSEIEAEGNGQKVTIKTTKVTINSGVSDADFK